MSVTISGSTGVDQANITGASIMPVGTTAQRPATPVAGMQRFNSDLGVMEYYNGTEWTQDFILQYQIEFLLVGGGGGGGGRFGGVGQAQDVALGASGGGNYVSGLFSGTLYNGNNGTPNSSSDTPAITVPGASGFGYSNNRGGGGRGAVTGTPGADGTAGIAAIRYPGGQRGTGGTVTTVDGYTIHTFTGSGIFTG